MGKKSDRYTDFRMEVSRIVETEYSRKSGDLEHVIDTYDRKRVPDPYWTPALDDCFSDGLSPAATAKFLIKRADQIERTK